ncbi:hypothetical protein CAPTEDRAFT_211348 [Capitella teleta]|uniref:RING-type domain-containing protein n=1 Tax=Capitella teleta TaxID=283909 RepID=R7TFE9_CAPTE|nr:hypothetical protein CAPTEDRAFT_211348 [Capitella teleta]|eukprot:ELT92503.1 hypothetical protein CAPTEDRAFT_211348 [Capitella teleta]
MPPENESGHHQEEDRASEQRLCSSPRMPEPELVPEKEANDPNSDKEEWVPFLSRFPSYDASLEKICFLCKEKVMKTGDHQFGILSHCNQVFCTGCLRGWRHAPGTRHMLTRKFYSVRKSGHFCFQQSSVEQFIFDQRLDLYYYISKALYVEVRSSCLGCDSLPKCLDALSDVDECGRACCLMRCLCVHRWSAVSKSRGLRDILDRCYGCFKKLNMISMLHF